MAMELRVLLLLPLCFPGLEAQPPDAEERRWEGSTLRVQCPYPAQQQVKGWCRMANGECKTLVKTMYSWYVHTNPVTKGKTTIEDNLTRGIVSITMTNLQTEDSGTYSCVYHSTTSDSYFPLKTISLNVFKELQTWELESVSVKCKYGAYDTSMYAKAWCRKGQSGCKIWLKTNYPSTRSSNKALEDRVVMEDDTQRSTLTITMQKLQARDTGVYWCAAYIDTRLTRLMEVRLSVAKRTQQYVAKESSNISVQCLYSTSHYGTVNKAWCKEGARKPCTVLADTNLKPSGDPRTPQEERVTIQDDKQQGIVTVTMGKLQAEDSGVYWCALYEDGQLFRMTEVTLSVPEASGRTTLSRPAGTTEAIPSLNTTAQSFSSHGNTFILLSGVLSILFLLALTSSITLYVMWRKQGKRRGNREAEDTYDKPEDIAQLDSTERMESPKDDSNDLKYAVLNFKSRLSSEDTLYCNVEPSQAHRKAKGEDVDYAVIALKHLPTNNKG